MCIGSRLSRPFYKPNAQCSDSRPAYGGSTGLDEHRRTRRDAFAARSTDCLAANDRRLLIGLPSPAGGDVGEWHATRLGRLPGTVPYRIACSCSASDVSRYHVHAAVPQLIADLASSLPVNMSAKLIAMTTDDGRGVMGDLLVAFARIGCP